MSFPLGSLRGDDGDTAIAPPAEKVHKRQSRKAAAAVQPPRGNPLRTPLWLIVGAVVWCLAVLAMVPPDPSDSAFSSSGSRELYGNRVGALGAWLSDLLLFCFGYSAWWLPVVGLRRWLASLAGLLRANDVEPAPTPRSAALWTGGFILLICASCALEWTRLYGWEHR